MVVAGYAVGGASAAVGLAAVQEMRVQNEIRHRSTEFPVTVAVDQHLLLDVSFPIAPAPQRVDVTYRDASGEHVLVIDMKAALAGLHLLPVDTSQPREGEQPP